MTKIRVNVFDLTPLNSILRFMKVGIYHTSVVIGDVKETYYGFAQREYTGIDEPEQIDHIPSSMEGTLFKTFEIGESQLSLEECIGILKEFKASRDWLSDNYNALYHNCNLYTLELCKALLGENNVQNYPYWVTRGENIGKFIYSLSISHFIGFVPDIVGLAPPIPPHSVMIKQEQPDVEL